MCHFRFMLQEPFFSPEATCISDQIFIRTYYPVAGHYYCNIVFPFALATALVAFVSPVFLANSR